MKKLLFVFVALLVGGARADNIVTSREYVDSQANTLQSELPAKNTNTVLLNTATAGAPGEKAIYDSSSTYALQQDSLVTAGAFNTAVQNALETEFVCIEWLGDVHDNNHCLLYQVRSVSKNLFDGRWQAGLYNPYTGVRLLTNPLRICGVNAMKIRPSTYYVVSSPDYRTIDMRWLFYTEDGEFITTDMIGGNVTLSPSNAGYLRFYIASDLTLSEAPRLQIEEGEVATPYVGNIYMPQGEQ